MHLPADGVYNEPVGQVADFSEFMWMADQDLEEFDQKVVHNYQLLYKVITNWALVIFPKNNFRYTFSKEIFSEIVFNIDSKLFN